MQTREISILGAEREHFAAIVAMERASGASSTVALTAGGALAEALERGHDIAVAIEGGEVSGWIWFSSEPGRGGENVGQIFRVAVADDAMRAVLGGALIEHARAALSARDCSRIRATIAADDERSRAILAVAGFEVDALMMELRL